MSGLRGYDAWKTASPDDEYQGDRRAPSELAENVRTLLEKSRAISKQTMEAILKMIEDEEPIDEDAA